MKKVNNPRNGAKFPLDTVSEKKRRGPKRRVKPDTVAGNADVFNAQFSCVWPEVGNGLLAAKSPEEVMSIFNDRIGTSVSGTHNLEFSARVFEILHDPNFPRVREKSQVAFLADSLAAYGEVTPRRSRDICAEARAMARQAHHIIRYEFHVECSCGYKGHSLDHACPDCGAPILIPLGVRGLMS